MVIDRTAQQKEPLHFLLENSLGIEVKRKVMYIPRVNILLRGKKIV